MVMKKPLILLFAVALFSLSACATSKGKGGGWYRNRNVFNPQEQVTKMLSVQLAGMTLTHHHLTKNC